MENRRVSAMLFIGSMLLFYLFNDMGKRKSRHHLLTSFKACTTQHGPVSNLKMVFFECLLCNSNFHGCAEKT